MLDLRRYQRSPIDVDLEFALKGATERMRGRGKDISLGGMFVQTGQPQAFSSELVVYVTLPGQRVQLTLPCIVRWVGGGGMGLQFGLIGARETYAITEATKSP